MKIDRMHAIDAVTINPHVRSIHKVIIVINTITAIRVRTVCGHFQNNYVGESSKFGFAFFRCNATIQYKRIAIICLMNVWVRRCAQCGVGGKNRPKILKATEGIPVIYIGYI